MTTGIQALITRINTEKTALKTKLKADFGDMIDNMPFTNLADVISLYTNTPKMLYFTGTEATFTSNMVQQSKIAKQGGVDFVFEANRVSQDSGFWDGTIRVYKILPSGVTTMYNGKPYSAFVTETTAYRHGLNIVANGTAGNSYYWNGTGYTLGWSIGTEGPNKESESPLTTSPHTTGFGYGGAYLDGLIAGGVVTDGMAGGGIAYRNNSIYMEWAHPTLGSMYGIAWVHPSTGVLWVANKVVYNGATTLRGLTLPYSNMYLTYIKATGELLAHYANYNEATSYCYRINGWDNRDASMTYTTLSTSLYNGKFCEAYPYGIFRKLYKQTVHFLSYDGSVDVDLGVYSSTSNEDYGFIEVMNGGLVMMQHQWSKSRRNVYCYGISAKRDYFTQFIYDRQGTWVNGTTLAISSGDLTFTATSTDNYMGATFIGNTGVANGALTFHLEWSNSSVTSWQIFVRNIANDWAQESHSVVVTGTLTNGRMVGEGTFSLDMTKGTILMGFRFDMNPNSWNGTVILYKESYIQGMAL